MRKSIIIFVVIVTLSTLYLCQADTKSFEKYGEFIDFTVVDKRGDERDVQVFVPFNIDYEVPAKVVWYFMGTNGIPYSRNIETTRLYTLGYDEKTVIVAPGLFQSLWSKGGDKTDYHLVKDIIEELKTLKNDLQQPLPLDLENMSVIGFSAGGGFSYHLAGKYPLIFNKIVFRKYIIHARNLNVTIQEDGSITGEDWYDVQAVRDLIRAYKIFPDERPSFFLSVGDDDHVGGMNNLEMMRITRDIMEDIGFEAFFYIVPGLRHRFYVDYTPDFYERIKNFLFPVHITEPGMDFDWRYNPGKVFEIRWTSELPREKFINIDLFSLSENRYFEIVRDLPDSGSYPAVFDDLPIKTGRYYIRLTTADHMDIAYSSPFKIINNPLKLILNATGKVDKAWVIKRSYGEITLTAEYMVTAGPCVKFKVYRKNLESEYRLIKEINVEELKNCRCTFLDKYLHSSETYTYKAEALDMDGEVLSTSRERTLLMFPKTSPPVSQTANRAASRKIEIR